MTTFAPIPRLQGDASVHGRAHHDFAGKSVLSLTVVFAASATAVSLGIATCGGWQRGGTLTEQVMSVALGGVAVLYVHLLPIRWNAFRALSRAATFVLWCVSVVVVLYGQVAFFMVSQQHAGNLRAATVPAPVVRLSMNLPPGRRTLTEIARDTAKVDADLARLEARRCTADCPALKARKVILAAQLAVLNTEAGEVRHREAEEDRLNAQADRAETLRATLRADPVASTVASWFGTTERRLELLLAVACAVVLEGAAITGWLLVTINTRQAGSREMVVSGRKGNLPEHDAVAREPGLVVYAQDHDDDRVGHVDGQAAGTPSRTVPAAVSPDRVTGAEEEVALNKIHQAVVTGQIRPTQESIRTLLRCGQPKAGSLNRQYLARFGRAGRKGNMENGMGPPLDHPTSSSVSPHIAPTQQACHICAQAVASPAMADA